MKILSSVRSRIARSLIMPGGVLVSEGERKAPKQPASQWALAEINRYLSCILFSVQSRQKCIRMPPGVGEIQITPWGRRVRRLSWN